MAIEGSNPRATICNDLDAYSELVAAETAIRQIIRIRIGDKWRADFDQGKLSALDRRRTEEGNRRDGVWVSQDLLDYTETYQLEAIIRKHWEEVRPVLGDKRRTETYLGIMLDVRNAIAHSRPLVPSERLLLAGAAGQIQNQLSRYRGESTGPGAFYASINTVRDSFGRTAADYRAIIPAEHYMVPSPVTPRLNVGENVTFECSATDPRDRELTWSVYLQGVAGQSSWRLIGNQVGAKTSLVWLVSADDVGEGITIQFCIANSSKYQRNNGYDDSKVLGFCVNPPLD